MSTESNNAPIDPRVQVITDFPKLSTIQIHIIALFELLFLQIELEKLNSATDNINRYEVELEVSIYLFNIPFSN